MKKLFLAALALIYLQVTAQVNFGDPELDENILNSSRSTDFITPKSDISRLFRDAVLDLARVCEFARPLVNSGRLSVPCTYDGSPLNGPDDDQMPWRTRPGSAGVDAPTDDGWLLDRLGNKFQLLVIGTDAPETLEVDGIKVETLKLEKNEELAQRYLGERPSAVYLMRPDQHVAGRWPVFDQNAVADAVRTATGN